MAETKKAESTSTEATTYEAERLIAESDAFFGEPSHVVAGALSGSSRKTFTKDQADKEIKKFLSSEVTADTADEEEE